jgi:hypothetical protein
MTAPQYRHVYVSAIVSMGPIITGVEWELEVLLANRGETTEHCRVQFHDGESTDIFEQDDMAVEPLRIGGGGLVAEANPGVRAWDLWWISILTTSLNLVPTMHFYVEDANPVPVTECYFSPGDFAVFPIRPSPDVPLTQV